jgi:tetratricopeptide (TPR) repeat protein
MHTVDWLRITGVLVTAIGAGVAPRVSANHAATQTLLSAPSAVSFSQDIAPILYARCAGCHRPGGPAPFSLTSYDDARRRAALIASVTRSRYMPPWKPEPGMGDFIGSRRLPDEDVARIERWAADGAPEGDPTRTPPLPHWTSGWQNGEPDLVVALPTYTLPPEGRDAFRNFVVGIPVTATKYVRGLEFRPGSSAIHHANIRLDYTAGSRRLDEADLEPGYEGLILHSADYPDGHFLGWTPGQFAPLAPKGLAWRLNPGGDFVVQLHMRPTGKPETLAPTIGLYLTDDAPTQLPAMLRLGRQNIDIAPGTDNYHSRDTYTLPVDAQVQAVQPHSHYRARQVTATALLPNGTTRPIIAIKQWDFAWQDVYRVSTPYWLPRGTQILTEFVMDNSAANPRNPEQPPARAHWGFRSSDEMADVWIQVLTHDDIDRQKLLADFSRKSTAEDVVGYETQLAVSPGNAALHDDVAVLYLQLGKAAEAARHFQAVSVLRPSSPVAWFNLGNALQAAGKYPEAAKSYGAAIERDPSYAAARVNLGNLRMQEGRTADAATEYRAALRAQPDDFSAHNNLGRLLLNIGEPAEASAHIEQALRVKPDDPEAHFNLAEASLTINRPRDAVSHFREAIRLRPAWEPALIGLSWLLSASADAAVRDPVEAVALASDVVARSRRTNPLALDALAAALAASGRFDEAAATAHEAAAIVSRTDARELAAAIARRIDLYEQHRAYVAPVARR